VNLERRKGKVVDWLFSSVWLFVASQGNKDRIEEREMNPIGIERKRYLLIASLPMGWGFVGLTRVFRWAGPGSLGRAHSIASLGRAGPEGARPGSPNEPNECFTSIFSF